MSSETNKRTYTLGSATFTLDVARAAKTLEGKSIINGRKTEAFDILPLRYPWAYDLYKTMKTNHWEPEDVPMTDDISQWKGDHAIKLSDTERWIIKMAIGYFSMAEGIVGDNIIHVVREQLTAAELKLATGRHAHEENIHADSLVYMLSSLNMDPYECEAMFEDIQSIKDKAHFVTKVSRNLRRDLDLTQLENKQLLAKNMFVFGQCMEGMQFYGLFGMVLALYRQNKMPGIGQMFRYTLRDESNHIELFRQLFVNLIQENPDIWTPEFQADLVATMKEGVELEKKFICDCLPLNAVGLTQSEFLAYIDYIADRRLQGVGLPEINPGIQNPLPWLAELMDARVKQNFFEGRVTEYQKASALTGSDDDL
jgi:ribonucleoside-diphosphate reductase beta chain